MAIIGISGKINSGKNTIANIIQWLTNPRIHTNPNIKIGEDSIVSYVSFEDWQKNKDSRNLWTNIWEQKAFAGKLKDIVCLLIGCTREQLEDRQFKEKELGKEWWYHKVQKEIGYGTELIPYSSSNLNLTVCKSTPRKLLQLIGTDLFRNQLHPNIWINSLFADYKSKGIKTKSINPNKRFTKSGVSKDDDIQIAYNEYPNWIITDCRFLNEAKAIKDRDGILIRVNREIDPKSVDWFKNIEGKEGKYIGDPKEAFEYLKKEKEKMNHPSETALDDYQGFNYIINNSGTIEDLIEKVREILKQEKII